MLDEGPLSSIRIFLYYKEFSVKPSYNCPIIIYSVNFIYSENAIKIWQNSELKFSEKFGKLPMVLECGLPERFAGKFT